MTVEEQANVRKHPLARCEECPLREDSVFIPSSGPDKAKLVIAGEAPGAQEVRTGKPFTGVSGKVLDALLTGNGVRRQDVFITNACLCRTEDNATPPATAIRACRPRFLAEVQEREPEAVVALGATAAQSLLDTKVGVTQLRVGPPKEAPSLPGVRIIPTFHPAAALRAPDYFPSIVTDFQKIRGTGHGSWSEPAWRVADDPADAIEVLRQLQSRGGPLAVDIEVGVEKDTAFDHPNEYDLLCVGIAYRNGGAVVVGESALQDGRVVDALRDLLCDPKVQIICQNGKFDLAGLFKITKGEAKLYFDTMLAHYCLDERGGIHSLGHMGQELLGTPDWKHVLDKYLSKGDSYANVPREVLYKYNAYDCVVTFQLFEMFSQQLEEQGLRGLHDFLCEASQQLMYMELNGFPIDVDYLNTLLVDYEKITEGIEKELHQIIGGYINPRSPKQIKEYYESKSLNVDGTAVDVLNAILERTNLDDELRRFTETLLRYRKEQKLYSTYIKGTRQRLYRGRVYPTYLLHGTVTGRLSCRNPNLQNIPRGSVIRKLFVPSAPDRVLLQADYSQAELRVLCALAHDEYLRSIFADPSRDIHGEFATRLYGPGWTKEQRVRTKAYVFGLAYGREEFSIAQEFNIPVAEAKRGMQLFFEAIPQVVEFQKEVKTRVLSNQDLVTPFGRHRRNWLITNDNVKDIIKESMAFLPQSTASDICLSAYTELRPKLKGLAVPRNIVHDAIIVDCKKEDVEEVSTIMTEVMTRKGNELFDNYVPFAVDISTGTSWGDFD